MPSTFRQNLAGAAALVSLLWALVLGYVIHKYPCDHNFHHDVNSPVLALELSENEGDIDAVLHRNTPCEGEKSEDPKKPKAWDESIPNQKLANQLDLVFIPLYAVAIWSFGRLFTEKTRLLAAGVTGAALFDYIEDWKIFDALGGANPPICVPSLIKWGLLGLVFVGVAVILFRSKSELYSLSTKRIISIGYLASGVLLLIDVALGWKIGYSLIALANGLFALLIVSNVIGLLGHYVALSGIRRKYVDNFCEERKKLQAQSVTAVEGEVLE